MNDTTPEVESALAVLFSRVSPGERVTMACEMFDLARALMIADITSQDPRVTGTQLRARIFERLYASDLSVEERRAGILAVTGEQESERLAETFLATDSVVRPAGETARER